MDDQRFDSIARKLASSSSRRIALKGLLGIGGISVAGMAGYDRTDAARRGFSGPSFSITPIPSPTPTCVADGIRALGTRPIRRSAAQAIAASSSMIPVPESAARHCFRNLTSDSPAVATRSIRNVSVF
jgi:hypothetical protein